MLIYIETDPHPSPPQADNIHKSAVKPQPKESQRQLIINKLTQALLPHNRNITLIVNSCGRFDLLQQTISSFLKYYPHATYPLHERIIIDDSRNATFAQQLIATYYPDFQIMLTANNEYETKYTHRDERITMAMDKLYSQVTTNWIYHIEDDWIFKRKGFIDESFDIFESTIPPEHQTGLKYVNRVGQTGLINKYPNHYRNPEGNKTARDHFFYDPNGLYSVVLCWNMYRKKQWCNRTYLYEYKDSQWYNMNYHFKKGYTWGGFSFNAGLQPSFLYRMYGKFFSPVGEGGKSEQMIKDGFRVAFMAPPACDHIGWERHVDAGELDDFDWGRDSKEK